MHAFVAWAAFAAPGPSLPASAPALAGAGGYSSGGAEAIAACRRQFAARPEERDSARCFWLEAKKPGAGPEAAQALGDLLAANPQNPGLELYAADVVRQAPGGKEWLLRSAAGKFAGHDACGEFHARHNLLGLLVDQFRSDEAAREVEREEAAARACREPERAKYLARASVSRAKVLVAQGEIRRAAIVLDEIPAAAREEGWWVIASAAHIEAGQLDRAWADCAHLAATSDHYFRASGFYCQTRVLLARRMELPSEVDRGLLEQAARAAATEAEAAHKPSVVVRARYVLAILAPSESQAEEETKRCLEAAGDAGEEKQLCEVALLRHQAAAAKAPARQLAGALSGIDLQDPMARAKSYGTQMRASWATRPFADRVADGWRALAEIEGLRARQETADARMEVFSTWSDDYNWFSGHLLEAAAAGGLGAAGAGECPTCLDDAFEVNERLRARTLQEILPAAGSGSPALQADTARLAALRLAMERVAGRRRDVSLPPLERENAAADLLALARDEEQAQQRRAETSAAPAPPAHRATLRQVQALLAPDQALLAFQIAPWADWYGGFGGGSWLVAVTAHARHVYRLGDLGREALRSRVADLREAQRDGFASEHARAASLYRQLLGPALAAMPPGIKRLLIVPDDDLHQLAFAALRATRDGPPLASRYQISILPSATLWVSWRTTPAPTPADRPALLLADPPPPTPAAARWFQSRGINLPPAALPAARHEAAAAVRYLGWGCERRVGDQVSQALLAGEGDRLRRFALVDLAAHSIIDDRDPERSGIWLSPAPGYSGLMQVPAIAKLRCDGRLIVLSTCSSNGGPVIHGEGVMSLAHAFFQAGARTVVASLSPQTDSDAEATATGLFRHLAAGASVGAALRQAQLDRLRADPRLASATWADVVVLGDGDLVPFPGGRRPWMPWLIALAALAVLAVLAAVLGRAAVLRRRAGRSGRRLPAATTSSP